VFGVFPNLPVRIRAQFLTFHLYNFFLVPTQLNHALPLLDIADKYHTQLHDPGSNLRYFIPGVLLEEVFNTIKVYKVE
jgi:hypothetical protein